MNYIYDGMATVDFGNSPADPLRSIPVLGVEAVYYLDFRFTLGWGRNIARLSAGLMDRFADGGSA